MGRLSPADRQVAHVLRTRSPVALAGPLDLHVLSTPPAFVLSQDQTLHELNVVFEIALSDPLSSRCCSVCNCVKTACPNHRNVRFKLSPILRTSIGSSSSPRTSRFPNSIIKQQIHSSVSHYATAFNHKPNQPRRQADFKHSALHFSLSRAPATARSNSHRPHHDIHGGSE